MTEQPNQPRRRRRRPRTPRNQRRPPQDTLTASPESHDQGSGEEQETHETRERSNTLLAQLERLPRWAQVTMGATAVLGFGAAIVLLSKVSPTATSPANITIASAAEVINRTDEEALALARARREEILMRADASLTLVGDLEADIKGWKQVDALLRNEDGRYLAADLASVNAFDAICSRDRMTMDQAKNYRKRIDVLASPIRKANGFASAFTPSEELVEVLDGYHKSLRVALGTFRDQRESIDVLVAEAKRNGVTAEFSLEDTILRKREAAASRRASLIASAVEKARDDAAREEAEAKAHQERILGKQRAENIRVQAEVQRQEDEVAQLRRVAEDPTVRAKFAPFLSKGRNPVGQINTNYKKLPYPMPASFRDLQRGASLKDLKRFVMCGAGKSITSRNNDRPRWTVPNTEVGWKDMQSRYNDFLRLAPVWIELGYLRR